MALLRLCIAQDMTFVVFIWMPWQKPAPQPEPPKEGPSKSELKKLERKEKRKAGKGANAEGRCLSPGEPVQVRRRRLRASYRASAKWSEAQWSPWS